MQVAELCRYFDSCAQRYDENSWLAEERDLAQADRLLQPEGRETGLDLACGPGLLAVHLARSSRRVLAADLSTRMLKYCAHRSTEAGQKNLTITLQDAHRMEFGDGMFDWISCRFGFRYFYEPTLALSQLKRVLKPGGRIWLSEWISDYPGGESLPLTELLTSLDPAQQPVLSMQDWKDNLAEAGFSMKRCQPRPDRIDAVALGDLSCKDAEESAQILQDFRAGPGKSARYLDLEGRPALLVQRLDLLLGI